MPMHPLIEVSTDQGRNMRGTCARVLAAALMTGAIATVMATAALFGAPRAAEQPLTAPPSSLQRSVRAVPLAVPKPRRRSVERPLAAHRVASRPTLRPVVTTHRLVVFHRHGAHHPAPARRQLASTTPVPTPTVEPAPAPTPAPVPATPPVADDDPGNGHAYGHDKQHGRGHQGHEE
jgi:hypothetical protein